MSDRYNLKIRYDWLHRTLFYAYFNESRWDVRVTGYSFFFSSLYWADTTERTTKLLSGNKSFLLSSTSHIELTNFILQRMKKEWMCVCMCICLCVREREIRSLYVRLKTIPSNNLQMTFETTNYPIIYKWMGEVSSVYVLKIVKCRRFESKFPQSVWLWTYWILKLYLMY